MLGAIEIYNLSCFDELALHLGQIEFKERFLASAKNDQEKMKNVKKGIKWNQNIGNLPILSSECPGWVCYAEKTHGEEAFPFMSKVKSPQ